jgi:lysophospholipase L1-like esterase
MAFMTTPIFQTVKYVIALPVLLAVGGTAGAGEFNLAEGDRVVLVGNTLIEREQRYGYWEAALTARYHGRNITFRNLGWSGDTVFGHARAGFGTTADGFQHLKEHVLSLKPTVIVVGYGANESFEGAAGLPKFLDGLNILLETVAPTKARIVLLSPLRQEDLGRPLPAPVEQNKNLRSYADAIRDTAQRRRCAFVDLYEALGDGAGERPPAPLTDNGIHLTAFGYWRSAFALEKELELPANRWSIQLTADGSRESITRGAQVTDTGHKPLRFKVTDDALPLAAPPDTPADFAPPVERRLRIQKLDPGKHTLTVDGRAVLTASAEEWAAGMKITRGPEFEQAEQLREAVVAKNRLYFHRWRPQNETYLFGFRKAEQGKNAVEVPQFDPLVVKQEEAIGKLRVPVTHTYEIKPEAKP